MGARNSCGCGSGAESTHSMLYDIEDEDWADAVTTLNVAGIKMLHQEDPELINCCVTERGEIAIHIAILRGHFELFRYFLRFGGDINALRGDDGNSCLHLAVINRDLNVIKELFKNDVDDSLINKDMKTAFDLIVDTHFRRQFMRTKNSNRYQYRHVKINQMDVVSKSAPIEGWGSGWSGNHSLSSLSPISPISGINENDSGYISLQNYHQIWMTSFGSKVGCEVKDIAYYLQEMGVDDKSNKVWEKWVQKEHITKPHDLVKIIYGLTVLTLREGKGDKERHKVKPPSQPIARLTSRVYQMLPVVLTSTTTTLPTELNKDRKKRRILTKDNFILNFHTYLYRVHEEMVEEKKEKDKLRKKSFV